MVLNIIRVICFPNNISTMSNLNKYSTHFPSIVSYFIYTFFKRSETIQNVLENTTTRTFLSHFCGFFPIIFVSIAFSLSHSFSLVPHLFSSCLLSFCFSVFCLFVLLYVYRGVWLYVYIFFFVFLSLFFMDSLSLLYMV